MEPVFYYLDPNLGDVTVCTGAEAVDAARNFNTKAWFEIWKDGEVLSTISLTEIPEQNL